jgi:hypothetical protein
MGIILAGKYNMLFEAHAVICGLDKSESISG